MANQTPSSTEEECATCHKPSTPESPLKRCSRCKTATYCSVDCQKVDWKSHKQHCAGPTQGTTGAHPNESPRASNAGNPGLNTRSTSGHLEVHVEKPFHKIHERKWLHDRPEKDVYKLLIDTYRLRMWDDYIYGDVDAERIFNDVPDGRPGFCRFLRKVESKPGLLPDWWSPAKAQECVAFGSGYRGFNLDRVVEKQDIIELYGDPRMPMKQRMFGEQIWGSGPGGVKGASMLEMQMALEDPAAALRSIEDLMS